MANAYLQTLEKVKMTVDGRSFEAVAASFRGVAFFVEDYQQGGGGRTVVTKKIPFSNDFVNEDLGGNIPTHQMNIFLVGIDCDVQKQNLLKACATEGPGELVHPWLGKFDVRCSAVSFSASRASLGYVKGSITFVVESAPSDKAVSINYAGMAKAKSRSFLDDIKDAFGAAADFVKKGKDITDAINEGVNAALDAVSAARQVMASVTDFVQEIGKIKANIGVLLATPADFAARIAGIISLTGDVLGIDTDPNEDANEYLQLMQFRMDSSSKNSVAVAQVALIQDLVCMTAASSLAKSLVDCKFASVDDALDMQNRVNEAFENLLERTADIDQYMKLSDLAALAMKYLRENMANMAVVIERENPFTTNILYFAYDVYGNLDRIDEIMTRNHFSQGLFVLPGMVKVLSK